MKRLLDIVVAVFTLVSLLVPLLLLAMVVKSTSKGPILFWSKRIGQYGQPFNMPKFRTMLVDAPLASTMQLTNAHAYITPVGHILRKTSLDELPQLISVIRGEMSLVGPRPILTIETKLIAKRNSAGIDDLKPGITGWAQINGRDDLSETEKITLDAEYMAQQSLLFDLKILWQTFFYVLRLKGVRH